MAALGLVCDSHRQTFGLPAYPSGHHELSCMPWLMAASGVDEHLLASHIKFQLDMAGWVRGMLNRATLLTITAHCLCFHQCILKGPEIVLDVSIWLWVKQSRCGCR